MDFFPVSKNSTSQYFFEKSATYFDGELVPKRAHALLPQAKLVNSFKLRFISFKNCNILAVGQPSFLGGFS